jgi:hypothetical protein
MPEPPTLPVLPFGVSVGDLAKALGSTRTTVLRAVEDGTIAAADGRTPAHHRRWSPALAAKIVRSAGKQVPKSWAVA